MGWARYTEDIEERYFDDTRERYEKYLAEIAADAQVPKHLPAGEVSAMCNGRRFEDTMAFPVGAMVVFRVATQPGCAPAIAELRDQSDCQSLIADSNDEYRLLSKTAASVRLVLLSGGNRKEYLIHFLEEASIDRIPDLAALIVALTANPPAWTTETFPPFRTKLGSILKAQSVPQQFADGIVEYHLALFYESLGSRTFGQLLERSNELLRCFAPYSDYAAMVCAFYLFRTNAFEYGSLANISRLPTLRRIFHFFTTGYDKAMKTTRAWKQTESSGNLNLLVPPPDYETIQLILQMMTGGHSDAMAAIDEIRARTQPEVDPQREMRLTFLEARIHRANGRLKRAATCYEGLKFSSQVCFQTEARDFLHL